MRRIGLALGGGGARGWAHIGVLDALEEAGVRVDCVVGCSMGALVGATCAAGRVPVLKDVALKLDWKQALFYFLEVTFPRSGLVDGGKIEAFVRKHVAVSDLESLPIPCVTVATDVLTGQEVVIRKGDVIKAVRASISIPGIFTPVARDGAVLVDGGLVNPVPINVAREMGADFVIAVDLNHGTPVKRPATPPPSLVARFESRLQNLSPEQQQVGNLILRGIDQRFRRFDRSVLAPARRWLLGADLPNIFDVLGNTIHIIEAQITECRLKTERPDLLIRPAVADVSFMEFHRAKEAMQAGYLAAREELDKLSRHALHRIQRKS